MFLHGAVSNIQFFRHLFVGLAVDHTLSEDELGLGWQQLEMSLDDGYALLLLQQVLVLGPLGRSESSLGEVVLHRLVAELIDTFMMNIGEHKVAPLPYPLVVEMVPAILESIRHDVTTRLFVIQITKGKEEERLVILLIKLFEISCSIHFMM